WCFAAAAVRAVALGTGEDVFTTDAERVLGSRPLGRCSDRRLGKAGEQPCSDCGDRGQRCRPCPREAVSRKRRSSWRNFAGRCVVCRLGGRLRGTVGGGGLAVLAAVANDSLDAAYRRGARAD